MGDWDDLMLDTVTIEPFVSMDEYSKPTYGDAEIYRARITGKLQKIVAHTGEDKVSKVRIYLVGTPAISVFDRITLPSGWTPTQPPILAVGMIPDETGMVYVTIDA